MALNKIRKWSADRLAKITGVFVKKSDVSQKPEMNFKAFKILGITAIFLFIAIVVLLPDELPIEFSEKTDHDRSDGNSASTSSGDGQSHQSSAQSLWGSPTTGGRGSVSSGSQINYNTSMILGSSGANAKTQLASGIRLPLRLLDKVIVSQDSVPVLFELILDSLTDSGIKLQAGTRFYGEASFARGSERATIRFTQISLHSGQIRQLNGMALGKDGQPGIQGRVFSDGTKNTTGQLITTFVAGLASGSVQTDFMGNSKGGLENGLLSAVVATAKDRAIAYGERMKTEREWIELGAGTECDALLSQALNLQNGGDSYDK